MAETRRVEQVSLFELQLPLDDVCLGPFVPLNEDIADLRLQDGDADIAAVDLNVRDLDHHVPVLAILFLDPFEVMTEKDLIEDVSREGEDELHELSCRVDGVSLEFDALDDGVLLDDKRHRRTACKGFQIDIDE